MTQQTDSFEEIESAVVRFAGDSGDGMQTVGERFTDSSAFAGNDIATLPDFPAEIRAPQVPLPVFPDSIAVREQRNSHSRRYARCSGGHEPRRPQDQY